MTSLKINLDSKVIYHSCETALNIITDQWLHFVYENEYSGVLFVDLCKAFDQLITKFFSVSWKFITPVRAVLNGFNHT